MTPSVVVSLVGLAIALLIHTVIVARWSSRIQTLVEMHDAEVKSLRIARHEHANLLTTHTGAIEFVHEDMKDLKGRVSRLEQG